MTRSEINFRYDRAVGAWAAPAHPQLSWYQCLYGLENWRVA